jgi:hypothetical protein
MGGDAQNVPATGDIPTRGELLGGLLASGLKQVVQQTVRKNCRKATQERERR